MTFKSHTGELNKRISRSIGVHYKLRSFVTTKIITNVYYAIIYPFLLYGITIWGMRVRLLSPIHNLQKKIVRMATFNDNYPDVPGPLPHTPPLFYKLNVLNVFDIYKLQVGMFVYESVNDLGPSRNIIKYTKASEVLCHNTRYNAMGISSLVLVGLLVMA